MTSNAEKMEALALAAWLSFRHSPAFLNTLGEALLEAAHKKSNDNIKPEKSFFRDSDGSIRWVNK